MATTTNNTTDKDENDETTSAPPKIMTVLGPIQGTNNNDDDDDNDDLGWVLMNEHLVCDETVKKKYHHQHTQSTTSSSNITLENLHELRQHPWHHSFNMLLSNTSTIVDELEFLLNILRHHRRQQQQQQQQQTTTTTTTQGKKKKKVLLTILDVTSLEEGRNYKAIQALAKNVRFDSELQFIIGTTCSGNKDFDGVVGDVMDTKTTNDKNNNNMKTTSLLGDNGTFLKKQIARMEQELLYGIDFDNNNNNNNNILVRAGFIGQVKVSATPTETEWKQLKACAIVQGSTKAPLIVAIPEPPQPQPPSSSSHVTITNEKNRRQMVLDIVQTIETFNGGNLQSKTVLCHMDLYHYDVELIEMLLNRGYIIGLDRYSVGHTVLNLDSIYPTITDIVTLLHTLLGVKKNNNNDNPKYIDQIVLSVGIEMKLQYQKYGGPGYPIVWELAQRLIQSNTVTASQLEILTTKNPRKLLSWWTPPPEPIKPIEYLECSICKKLFEPILGQYYQKYTFTYCGRECLTKHRQNKFKPII